MPRAYSHRLAANLCCDRLHDKDKSGTIGFEEFKSLHVFLSNTTASFKFFDTDRSGSLELKEVQQAVIKAGFKLDDHAFHAACKAFDPSWAGKLSESEFIGLIMFLTSCKGIFEVFDSEKTDAATLSYSQFVYAAANTR